MDSSLTELAVSDIKQKAVSKDDLNRAATHVIDWIGNASLGAKSQAGKVFGAMLEPNNSSGCTALFSESSNWQEALSYNAAIGNVLEMDDIHRSSILHPGPVIIPAALAIAERQNSSLEEFFTAIIRGYEITIRLGESIGRSHYKYFHNTSSCAAFGAALAAASLLNLTEQQTVWALGNVGSRTGGLWQMRNEQVLTKQWHNAEAALSGVRAALMAQQGLTGPLYILEGDQGIFNAMSNDAQPQNFLRASDDWRIYDCSFKPWPACRHAHPAIDAFLHCWKPTTDLTQVQKVTIRTYKDAMVFCNRLSPKTELQAKFSIQHALSAIMLWGEPQLEHYSLAAINNEQAAKLRELIVIEQCADFEAAYPYHYGAECLIQFENGTTTSDKIKDTLGDPERPMAEQEIKSKAANLMQLAGIESLRIDELLSMQWVGNNSIKALTALIEVNSNP